MAVSDTFAESSFFLITIAHSLWLLDIWFKLWASWLFCLLAVVQSQRLKGLNLRIYLASGCMIVCCISSAPVPASPPTLSYLWRNFGRLDGAPDRSAFPASFGWPGTTALPLQVHLLKYGFFASAFRVVGLILWGSSLLRYLAWLKICEPDRKVTRRNPLSSQLASRCVLFPSHNLLASNHNCVIQRSCPD